MTTTTHRTLLRLAAVAGVATLALAATPSTGAAQTIEGCYVPKSGSVYRINADGTPTACSKNHVYFSWNAQGEKGATGEKGDKGDKGDQGEMGPAGPAGSMTLVFHQSGTTTIGPGGFSNAARMCPDGGRLVSGGHAIDGSTEFILHESRPHADAETGLAVGWRIRVTNTSSQSSLTVRTYMVCTPAAE